MVARSLKTTVTFIRFPTIISTRPFATVTDLMNIPDVPFVSARILFHTDVHNLFTICSQNVYKLFIRSSYLCGIIKTANRNKGFRRTPAACDDRHNR